MTCDTQDCAIKAFQEKLDAVAALRKESNSSPTFRQWHHELTMLVETSFGEVSSVRQMLQDITFVHSQVRQADPQVEQQRAFLNGLTESEALIRSIIPLLENSQRKHAENDFGHDISNLTQMLRRFPHFARQITKRHANRLHVEIKDEYDVQDIIHGLLWIWFSDIRAEEVTPSYAGGSSRVDFLLKSGQIALEVKKTRDGLHDRELGDQLIVDIGRYRAHPDCRTLVCFAYNPDFKIANPRGLEIDLSRQYDNLSVIVIIEPQ